VKGIKEGVKRGCRRVGAGGEWGGEDGEKEVD